MSKAESSRRGAAERGKAAKGAKAVKAGKAAKAVKTAKASARAQTAANGGAPPRRRDRERTITTILDAAEKLLEEKGPDGFGLAELGREAGISFGLIHHYFGGKEGLLKRVLRRTLRDMGQEVRKLQDDGSFWRRDAPAVLVVFDTFVKRPGFARLGAWGLLTGLITADDVAHEFRADREALEAMIEAFREEAPEPTRENVTVITTLMWSAVLGFTLLRPLLTSSLDWSDANDAQLREQLAAAMVGLTRSK